MSNSPDQTCALCGLPVPRDGLDLKAEGRDFSFCCEGCRGIWVMLNPNATAKDKGTKNDEH